MKNHESFIKVARHVMLVPFQFLKRANCIAKNKQEIFLFIFELRTDIVRIENV